MKVIVTGSASGIGQAVASVFEDMGHEVVGLDLSTGCDVTDPTSVKDALAGHLDARVLINCAGVGFATPMHKEKSAATFKKVIDINLIGTFNVIDAVYEAMRDNPEVCSIVNLSSIWGLDRKGGFGLAGYRASKFGVRGMTKVIQEEGAKKGVRATCICPTYVATPLVNGLPDKVKQAMIDAECPTGEMLDPEYVAQMITIVALAQADGVNMNAWTDRALDGTEDKFEDL